MVVDVALVGAGGVRLDSVGDGGKRGANGATGYDDGDMGCVGGARTAAIADAPLGDGSTCLHVVVAAEGVDGMRVVGGARASSVGASGVRGVGASAN
jgi:hypothetical protein